MRGRRAVLILAVLVISWLGMQWVHELGHVAGCLATGGTVERVVWHPFTISRTDLGENPNPLTVVWSGPVLGVIWPGLAAWLVWLRGWSGGHVLRFFAGFCLVANGLYIGVGSVDGVGDAGDMLRLGTARWILWAFGLATVPLGLWCWHGQGPHFGIGPSGSDVDRRTTWVCAVVAVTMLGLGCWLGGDSAWNP